jgi:hypothetical protein
MTLVTTAAGMSGNERRKLASDAIMELVAMDGFGLDEEDSSEDERLAL